MILDRVDAGHYLPDEFNVIIEIPAHSDPVKYEVDKETGALFVDRFMNTAMHYPCNYGYIPHTLGQDGDPLDAMVLLQEATFPGALIECRAIGMFRMQDEMGGDDKVLCIPVADKRQQTTRNLTDIPDLTLLEIEHFFSVYKDLEPGKSVEGANWVGRDEAEKEVVASFEREKQARAEAEGFEAAGH